MERILYSSVKFLIIIWIIYEPLSTAEPIKGPNISPANVSFIASIATRTYDFIEERSHFCSGSLIAEKLVLTAAHCIDDEIPNKLDIVIGAADLKGAKPKYDVQGWRRFKVWAARNHPRFMRIQSNDLAIIMLKTPVVGVTAANITRLRNKDLYGKNATIIGWTPGKIRKGRFLHKARVEILTPEDCGQRHRELTNFPYRGEVGTLCTAANPFALNTGGDSGAPLLDENNNILGITEGVCPRNAKSCDENYVNLRKFNYHLDFLDEYRQFINDVMKESS